VSENPKRLTRKAAARTLSEMLGVPLSVRTLRRLALPYRMIGREAVYLASDLEAYALQKFASAPIRQAAPEKRTA
jgi:hypothetical protein